MWFSIALPLLLVTSPPASPTAIANTSDDNVLVSADDEASRQRQEPTATTSVDPVGVQQSAIADSALGAVVGTACGVVVLGIAGTVLREIGASCGDPDAGCKGQQHMLQTAGAVVMLAGVPLGAAAGVAAAQVMTGQHLSLVSMAGAALGSVVVPLIVVVIGAVPYVVGIAALFAGNVVAYPLVIAGGATMLVGVLGGVPAGAAFGADAGARIELSLSQE